MAAFFGVDESCIWPGALGRDEIAAVSRSEVVVVWPHRWAVARDTWGHFFGQAVREIGALVYSGMFMAEGLGVHRLFADRARAGVRVRLLLGDPDSRNVAERGTAEGIDEGMAAKVRNSIVPGTAGRPLIHVTPVRFYHPGHPCRLRRWEPAVHGGIQSLTG